MRILIAIFVLGIVILVHEFGHFMVAKISNMRVEKFSIGMGPAITSIKKGETTDVIGMIPAGGYVQVTGEQTGLDDEDDLDEDDPRRYGNRPLLSRLLFAAAGSFMNIFVAIVMMVGLFMISGVSTEVPSDLPKVASITENSPAQKAGLKEGDTLVSLTQTKIETWDDIAEALQETQGKSSKVTVSRDGKLLVLNVVPELNQENKNYYLGITRLQEVHKERLNFPKAVTASLEMTKRISTLVYDAVKNLVSGKTSITDKKGGLTGPVGIVKVIDNSLDRGIDELIFLMSMLSINLGLMNLLPIPAVDGSKILFLILEGIRGIPIDSKKEGLVNFLGFICLMALMIYVTVNDISGIG